MGAQRWGLSPAKAAVLLLALLPFTPLISSHTALGDRVSITPWVLWVPVGGLLVAALLGSWLGVAIGYVILRGAFSGHELGLWTPAYVAIGAGALWLVGRAPRSACRTLLVAVALLEGLGASWAHGQGGDMAWGTFGNPSFFGAALAVALPLAAWWLVPAFLVGVLLSHSWLAAAASGVALMVRWPRWGPVLVAFLGVLWINTDLIRLDKSASLTARLDAWSGGARDWLAGGPIAWLVGYGPGSWIVRRWNADCPCPPGEVWTAAHHEPLQWLYETGVVGVVLLGGWLTGVLPAILEAPPMWRAAAASVGVLMLGLHVFHLPTLAPLMLLALGGAMQGKETPCTA